MAGEIKEQTSHVSYKFKHITYVSILTKIKKKTEMRVVVIEKQEQWD